MAITIKGALANGNENPGTADNSLIVTFAFASAVADTLFLGLSYDNTAAATPTVSSVVDSRGNTWTQVGDSNASTATAAAAVRCTVWRCDVTVAHQVNDTLTVTLSATVKAKAGVVLAVSGASGAIGGLVTSRGTSAMTAQSITPNAIGDCVIGFAAFEDNAAATGDSDTLNGSWSTAITAASTGGSSTSNAAINAQAKVITATGAQSWQMVGASDWSSVAFYIAAAVPATPSNVSGTGTVQTGHVIVTAALPANVAGVGAVKQPTGEGLIASPLPSRVAGVGSVQTGPSSQSGSSEPTWGGQSVTTTDGDYTWLGSNPKRGDASGGWQANQAWFAAYVTSANGHVWQANNGGGTTGSTPPNWASAPNVGNTVVDNNITWTNLGTLLAVGWTANHAYPLDNGTNFIYPTGAGSFQQLIADARSRIVVVASPSLATVAGTGTVQTPVGIEIAKPSNVSGTGTVQSVSIAATSARIVRFSMTDLVTPPNTLYETLSVRARKANVSDDGILRVGLYQASTLIQTWDVTLTDSFVTTDLDVTSAASITDFTALEVQLQALAVGASVTPQVSALYFTTPISSSTPATAAPSSVSGTGTVQSVTVVVAPTPAYVRGVGGVQGSFGVYSSQVLSLSPKLYLRLNGPTDTVDASGNGHVVSTNPPYLDTVQGLTAGDPDNAVRWNIDSDLLIGVSDATDLHLPTHLSIAFAIVPKYHTGYAFHIAYGGYPDTANFVIYLFGDYLGSSGDQGIIGLWATAGGVWQNLTGQIRLTLDVAQHVVMTYDSAVGGRLYVNGSEVAANLSAPGSLADPTGNSITFGGPNGQVLDEFAIFDTTLSADQTFNLFRSWASALAPALASKPSHVSGTGTVQAPTVVEQALPATVAGTGTVQSPVGVEQAKPSQVSGVGTVPTPTGTDLPLPATVAGTGSVQSLVVVEAAKPSVVNGIGLVQAVQILTAVTVTPSVVAGMGSVQSPTGLEASLPSAVAGTGTVQALVIIATAKPSLVSGIGSVQTVVILTAVTVTPSVVAGVGLVQSPTELGVSLPTVVMGIGTVQVAIGAAAATPANVAGTGTVQVLVAAEALVLITVAGTGTVQPLIIVEQAKPTNVAGVGTVQSLTIIEVALPGVVAGVGTVQAPIGTPASQPSNVAGTGTVQSAVILIYALPTAVAGTGTVQTPIAAETLVLVTVSGTGTVQSLVIAEQATPVNVAGVGTIQIPTIIEIVFPVTVLGTGTVQAPVELPVGQPSNVAGTGTVQSVTILIVALPATVPGIGTVQSVVQTEQAFPPAVSGTGVVQVVVGAEQALPLIVLGLGSVFTPTISIGQTAAPAAVFGIGTVGSPTIALVVLVTAVPGVGSVQAPIGLEFVLAAAVNGIGSTFAPLITITALPVVVPGTGTVFAPTESGVILVAFVSGIGSVAAASIQITAVLSAVLGSGFVQIPTGASQDFPGFVLGIGTVQAPLSTIASTPAYVAGIGVVSSLVLALVALPDFVSGIGTVLTPTIIVFSLIALTISDAIGASDQAATTATTERAVADQSGLSDSAVSFTGIIAVLADALALADAMSTTAVTSRTVTNALGLLDESALTLTAARMLLESLGSTDSMTPASAVLRSILDAQGLLDTATEITLATRSTLDSASISDATREDLTVALSDVVNLIDTATEILVATRSISDVEALSDLTSAFTDISARITETLGALETLRVDATFLRSLVETERASDQIRTALVLLQALADLSGLLDQATRVATGATNIVDLQTIMDAWSSAVRLSQADTLNSTDAANSLLSALRSLADLANASDLIEALALMERSQVDVQSEADSLTSVSVTFNDVTDLLSLVDSTMEETAFASLVDDLLTLTDASAANVLAQRLVAEIIEILDEEIVSKPGAATIVDPVGVVDSLVRFMTQERENVDFFGLTDVASLRSELFLIELLGLRDANLNTHLAHLLAVVRLIVRLVERSMDVHLNDRSMTIAGGPSAEVTTASDRSMTTTIQDRRVTIDEAEALMIGDP